MVGGGESWGEVCRVVGGSTPSSHVPKYWDGDIVWITPTDLGKLEKVFVTTSARKITKDGYENCGTDLVPVGSVVLSSRAPIGHLGIASVPLCTNQGCKTFVPSSAVDSHFLFYALKISVSKLQALGSGATFAEISKTELERFEIPLPPLAEQKRIAGILKEQMAAVERARASAEAQLQATENLPAAYLRAVFNSPEAQAWPKKKLGEVCEVVTGNTPSKAQSRFYGGTIPWIKPDDLDRTMYVESSSEYLSDEGANEARVLPKGTVLVTCIGILGKSAIAARPLATNQQINSLIPRDGLDSVYLYYACKTLKAQMETASSISLVTILNKSGFSELVIPVPLLSDQRRIASQLSSQMASADRLRQMLTDQLDAINKLPAALLRRAFNGELSANPRSDS